MFLARILQRLNRSLHDEFSFEYFRDPSEENPALVKASRELEHEINHDENHIVSWIESVPEGAPHEGHEHGFVSLLGI
jgi:hypothetical protein